MLIPLTYSLVGTRTGRLDDRIISQLQSSDSFVSTVPQQVSLFNSTATVNNLTSFVSNTSVLPIELSPLNETSFKENDFMIISGSNNASQVSLISSIFHNSRKPKKSQSRIFFIPIRSLVPLSFNGTTVILDSRMNSTSSMTSTASGVNNGNVTFVLLEENTNATVTASLVPNAALMASNESKISAASTTTTTTAATTTVVPTTAAVVTSSEKSVPSSTVASTVVANNSKATTIETPSATHNLNDRVFFAPITPVTQSAVTVTQGSVVVTQPTAVTNVTPTVASPVASVSNNAIASATALNSVPIGLLSNTQASLLLRQFALNSSEQLLNSSSPECERQLDQTDSCMRTVLLVNGNIKSPTTFDELDSIYCKNLTGILRCLGGYSKCLHRVPRIIYNFVYLHIKRTLEQVCKNTIFRSEIIFHSRCFAETKELNVVKRIVDQGTLTALYVLKFIPTNKIVGWGCCGYQKMFHDGIQQINQVCKQKTANNTGEFAMGFLHAAASDLIDIGCRKYSSVELCHENLPEAMVTFTQLTSGPVPEQRYSPVIPLIEISRRLASSID